MSCANQKTRAMKDAIGPSLTDGSQPKSPQQLFRLLDQLDILQETTHHAPMFTVSQSKKLRTASKPGAHTKNLFLRNKKGVMWLVTCDEDSRLDLHTLSNYLGTGRLSFGSTERLMKFLGVVPGCVSPFSLINDSTKSVTFVMDRMLLNHEAIHLHPLNNSQTTSISIDDLFRFLLHIGHPAQYVTI